MNKKTALPLLALLTLGGSAMAHDTWVLTNSKVVRQNDTIHIDLMLGNHGNQHRDFKLASKVDIKASTLELVAPDGSRTDLKSRLKDIGASPTEGYWTAKVANKKPGLYAVAHTFDKVMSYAPERAIKSAKTYFVVSKSLDHVPVSTHYERPLGHPLEIVPITDPISSWREGGSLGVRLLYKGKPLPAVRVAFIPRGETLLGETDARYEKLTDSLGQATFTPREANYYLVVAHWKETKEKGAGYDFTLYGATLTLHVSGAESSAF